MNFADIYQKSLNLPEPLAREAPDFIELLGQRQGLKPSSAARSASSEERKTALAHLAGIRFDFGGKPMPDRDSLYDEAAHRVSGY